MGKTITTFLVDGDPKGTQYSFIDGSICQVFVVPRSDLGYLNKQEKLQKPAFYILQGEDSAAMPQAYIGETENFRERVKDHDSRKEFWQRAFIFVSKDQEMTKVDVQYLEHRAIKAAKEANIFLLEDNKQIPKAPNLPEYRKAPMDDFFEDIKFLASFVGCNIFEASRPSDEHIFYVNNRGSNAKGYYDASGFTVLKGSVIVANSVPSFSWKNKREEQLKQYASKRGESFVLNSDIIFASPSTAAQFCIGRNSNGWKEWKNKEEQTLDEVYRKPLDQPE